MSTQSSQESAAERELEQRLAALKPRDTTRGFLFNAALELVRSQGDAEALARCVQVTEGRGFNAFFAYPIHTLLNLTYAAARELSGRYGGFDGAVRQLGFSTTPRFLESSMGKMLLSLAGMDARKLIGNMPSAYMTAWNHGSCTLSWSGTRSGRFTYVNVMPVAYFTGSVLQILSVVQAPGAQATGRQTSLTGCQVDFSWK